MSNIWKIIMYDGDNILDEWSVSGALSEPEIHIMLQRLVSQNLTEEEVVAASLRKNDPEYVPLLERVGRGNPISYGQGIHYTAEIEKN